MTAMPDAILADSPYLQHQLERHPEWQAEFATSHPYHAGELVQKLVTEILAQPDHDSVLRTVRTSRNREMVRIAWRDLTGMAELTETLRTTSDLADGLVEAAYRWSYAELTTKHGTPHGHSGTPQQMVILGMGKLGGQELNFSSDIDMIFAFPEAGETDGKRSLDNQTFFTRVGQRMIGILGQTTADGIAYRVDMRLRPFGEVGALALSFDAMEHYYETHGREWERYALVKARVMAGDHEQGAELMQRLQPFIYRRYLDYGALEQLRDMKAMINREAERRGKYQDVKLGTGGIREIEFTAQMFQLMRGGRIPALRERNLLNTLQTLHHQQLLSQEEYGVLQPAYHFLRRTENRLQMWNDEQTHSLPGTPERQASLAQSMGFADWETFQRELNHHQQGVAQLFQRVFAVENGESRPLPEHPEIQALLASRLYQSLTDTGRNRLNRLLPALVDACAMMADPDEALTRCLHIVQKVATRSGYIAMLADHPTAREQFVRLVSDSLWIATQLTDQPILLDQLLDPRQLYTPLDRAQLSMAVQEELARIDASDTGEVMERLRQFKQAQVLRVAAADITGVLPLMKVSDQLTWIAEAVLEETLRHVWNTQTIQNGAPYCTAEDGHTRPAGFAIIGYGKLGGLELGYSSDLDIIFLHDSQGQNQYTSGPKVLENGVFYARLAQRIIHTLTTFTPAGRLYETDMRLRPSGSSGLLVSSLEAFRNYQVEKAWIWEHQALLRARALTGNPELMAAFEQVRRTILCQERDPAVLRAEVVAMRQKMWDNLGSRDKHFNIKKDPGGITDIEFLVQYLILAHAHRHPELVTWSDNIRQLESLQQAGILPAETAEGLADCYRTLRDHIHALSLQEQEAHVAINQLGEEQAFVRAAWQRWVVQQ